MAIIPQTGVFEYLKVKCFLYKYSPPFTSKGPLIPSPALESISTYDIPLEEKYFTKYDISNYVVGYSFDQNLYDNTFGWSVTLEDHIITSDDFTKFINTAFTNVSPISNNVSLPVTTPPQEDVPNATSMLINMANYEIVTPTPYEKKVFINPASFVEAAKLERGNAEPELVEKLGGGQIVQGIRLSDLIQKYDMVSVFLYKSTTPLENLKGTVDLTAFAIPTDKGSTVYLPSFTPSSVGEGNPLSSQNLQYETILLSTYPNSSQTVFSNEFNGFVMSKTFTRNISGVDQVSISGNGITRLLGSTRRIIKPSLLQDSIYNEFSTQDLKTVSSSQTIFARQPVEQIISDLFGLTYQITFITDSKNVINGSLYDISAMQIRNANNAILFTVPPYLLSLVMKYRLFNFRQIPISEVSSLADPSNIGKVAIASGDLNSYLEKVSESQISFTAPNPPPIPFGSNPVKFDPTLLNLQTYFQYIDSVYTFFNPRLSTPFEVLDDVKKVTMAEIFELPTGVIVIRNPQYNSIDNVHFSSDFNISSVSYTETVSDLISKMKIAYGANMLSFQNTAIQEYASVDGKLLKQFGPLESSVDANPNAIDNTKTDNTNNQVKDNLLERYADFFLRYHNARLNTGSLAMDLDNTVLIGDTFFDEKNNKFGYIIGISKSIGPGQPATMTLTLSFVRDAYNIDSNTKEGINLQFSILPTLEYVNGNQNADIPAYVNSHLNVITKLA